MKHMTNEWLKSAEDDLSVIEEIIEKEHLSHQVAFHAQQAVEKSLKAILEEYEIEVPRIHNLTNLLTKIPELGVNLDEDLLKMLDSLYIDSRYPGNLGVLTQWKTDLARSKGVL